MIYQQIIINPTIFPLMVLLDKISKQRNAGRRKTPSARQLVNLLFQFVNFDSVDGPFEVEFHQLSFKFICFGL